MRFLIEFGRRIHWWWFRKPTQAEYTEILEESSVECTLCGEVQLDEVCVECNSDSWVKNNPGWFE